jgi:hypothetical protein
MTNAQYADVGAVSMPVLRRLRRVERASAVYQYASRLNMVLGGATMQRGFA